jgi:8-oxo-dGTP pyrophosphatase MutT (NUDIX family)
MVNYEKMNWKKLGTEYLSKHPYFTARKDTCEMPNGTIVPAYYVVELPPSACALAITVDGKVILTKQYRHPIEEVILELPGGFMDEGEDPQTAIARELQEETGYSFSSIEYVGKVAANPGVLNNYTHLFLAEGGTKTSGQNLDYNEEIEIILLPVDEVKKMLRNNEFAQALHVCCMLYAFQKLDEKK